METKFCTKCKISKMLIDFRSTDKSGRLRAQCKACEKEQNNKTKESRRPYFAEYRLKNKDRQKERSIKYYINNKENISKRPKENRLQRRDYEQEYRRKNKDILNKKRRERYKTDPSFRLRMRFSETINYYLRKLNTKKDYPTWSKLPYTPQQLREHLEKLWEPWMNWDNYRYGNIRKKNLANRSYCCANKTSIFVNG